VAPLGLDLAEVRAALDAVEAAAEIDNPFKELLRARNKAGVQFDFLFAISCYSLVHAS
jgi:hypothetical protein